MIVAAVTNLSLAKYVNALFIVYLILLFCNVLLSFVPRIPYYRWLRAVLDFITESTNPYLNVFRRMTRPIGAGDLAFDVAPILAIFVLLIAQRILVGAILE